MRAYFSPWQTSTAYVTKPFLRKPAHSLRLNIGTLQNLPSCFHTSRFKSITSTHCQRPLQKHVNNHIDSVNGLTFVTRKHMSPQCLHFTSLSKLKHTISESHETSPEEVSGSQISLINYKLLSRNVTL